ncbi:MAG: preprotein translocase subunit SecG [Deltaproteobacteria bacterium]|nr:preprotein translocase subunit SecG [Deltaproteobacteria bacterium]MBW1924642.1 preprotein translocase subunit SecG [Deltaproteobacteria bacterium]MBW1950526.1 preprotein translocase subunit SecG [Deltaproteobacteria bacterium]MBW2103044.1 preprotein translocase subunit SecG [Deltaproteobacteria bacterium]MBW2348324.1 preprotein translocase subunit SecG [Deltaproteobacteria bacterium]
MKLIFILAHVAVCVALILIVLLQKGKGADMGAAFGGSSQTVFGSTGATTFLNKVTTIIAIVFMVTSLGLSFFFGRGSTSSIMDDVKKAPVPAAQTSKAPAPQNQGGK